MVPCGEVTKRMSFFGPCPSQLVMQGKTGFILEDDHFPGIQILELFFLGLFGENKGLGE